MHHKITMNENNVHIRKNWWKLFSISMRGMLLKKKIQDEKKARVASNHYWVRVNCKNKYVKTNRN